MKTKPPTTLLDAIEALRPGATECPGRLAQLLGWTMPALRNELEKLEATGLVTLWQGGRRVSLRQLRGPYRVGGRAEQSAATTYRRFVGVDYSGAGTPDQPQPGVQVALAWEERSPELVRGPHRQGRWSRRALFEWLLELSLSEPATIIGLDHALGLPWPWMQSQGLLTWSAVLRWALRDLQTHHRRVREARRCFPFPAASEGWRLCDRRAPGAKSLFHFDVPGCVATSTLAALPWIAQWRKAAPTHVHFWPFDGWLPTPGKTMAAEVFPSLWRSRFSPQGLGPDARDAWLIADWLRETCQAGKLDAFLTPSLPLCAKARARREGWILGVPPTNESGGAHHGRGRWSRGAKSHLQSEGNQRKGWAKF